MNIDTIFRFSSPQEISNEFIEKLKSLYNRVPISITVNELDKIETWQMDEVLARKKFYQKPSLKFGWFWWNNERIGKEFEMRVKKRIASVVYNDLKGAAQWFNQAKTGLELLFLKAIYKEVNQIAKNSLAY